MFNSSRFQNEARSIKFLKSPTKSPRKSPFTQRSPRMLFHAQTIGVDDSQKANKAPIDQKIFHKMSMNLENESIPAHFTKTLNYIKRV